MASFDSRDFEFDDGDDLSTAMGTEALAGNDMIQKEFATGLSNSQLPNRRIGEENS